MPYNKNALMQAQTNELGINDITVISNQNIPFVNALKK